LRGLAERMRAVRSRLEADHRGGGFRLAATVPLRQPEGSPNRLDAIRIAQQSGWL
jgi:hypothetical protein